MVDIPASLVSELRQRTGAGMMDCKRALVEAGGDMEAAVDQLRTAGLAKAAKKAGREASEGLVCIHKADDRHGAMIVLNCETDFVALGEQFGALASKLAVFFATAGLPAQCLGAPTKQEHMEELKKMQLEGGQTVDDALTDAVAKLGENIQIGSAVVERSENELDYLQDYLHLNKVGVLVCLTTGKAQTQASEGFQAAVKDIAMQIAAAMPQAPQAVDREGLDPEVAEREKAILMEQAKESGKPPEIVEKIVAGRLNKFYAEVCLLEQPFIKDDKKQVKDMLREVERDIGDTITIARFHRFELGA
ncbi:translation elongation factor Ts [bacterium]|nr:translation elongation factor Ts [bacterium]